MFQLSTARNNCQPFSPLCVTEWEYASTIHIAENMKWFVLQFVHTNDIIQDSQKEFWRMPIIVGLCLFCSDLNKKDDLPIDQRQLAQQHCFCFVLAEQTQKALLLYCFGRTDTKSHEIISSNLRILTRQGHISQGSTRAQARQLADLGLKNIFSPIQQFGIEGQIAFRVLSQLDFDHLSTCLHLFQVWSNQCLPAITILVLTNLKRARATLKRVVFSTTLHHLTYISSVMFHREPISPSSLIFLDR